MIFARFADSFWTKVPNWMQRPNGRKYLTSMTAFFDVAFDVARQGLHADLPGIGTPTALPFVGQMRAMIQGDGESASSYAARMVGSPYRVTDPVIPAQPSWIDRARQWGMQLALARALHEWVKGGPMVRVVNRAGTMVTCATDGTITRNQVTWNWDSLSNPERASWWAELWVIIYSPPWAETGPQLISPGSPPNTADQGIGHYVPRLSVDIVKGLLDQYKSYHSFVRCVIWSYDATLFDPSTPLVGWPDGTWGQWSYPTTGTGARHRSGRSQSCRYWEPERHPTPY